MANTANTLAVQLPSPPESVSPTPIIVGPGATFHHLAVKQEWVAEKQAELERAQAAYKALSRIPKVSGWRLSLVRERVRMLKKAVKAMQAGYVPIPRFDANDLSIDYTELPSEALVALAEVERAKVFDTVRFVTGREDNGARGWRRQRGRDPLLVGVIRTPGHQIMLPNGFQQHRPAREEHYLVCWWQPWDERDGDMF